MLLVAGPSSPAQAGACPEPQLRVQPARSSVVPTNVQVRLTFEAETVTVYELADVRSLSDSLADTFGLRLWKDWAGTALRTPCTVPSMGPTAWWERPSAVRSPRLRP
jgi:hypothetical protein